MDGKPCERKHHSRGFCKLHYERWSKWGDPLKVTRSGHGRGGPRLKRVCEVVEDGEVCAARHYGRGMCERHYSNWKRTGEPVRQRPTTEERFVANIELPADGDCWLWTAQRDRQGYGRLKGMSSRLAHRVAYELAIGPVPRGLHLHHVCGNTGCVNPDHLEVVTRAEHDRLHAAA